MAPRTEELLEDLATVIRELRAQGVEPALFGGLAVMVQTSSVSADPDEPPAPLSLLDPAGLARAVRVTRDMDLALLLRGSESIERLFERLGFRQDPREKFKYRRDTTVVDAIALETSPQDELQRLLGALAGEFELVRLPRLSEEIRVMGRAGLVVMKAVAWTHRYLDRDLADLAHLAVDDVVRGGTTRPRLEQLVQGLEANVRAAVRAVKVNFASRDATGPRAFCRVVRANLSGELVDEWEDAEDRVAEIAAFAVERLLADAT
jgi:hypothetical protein